MIGSSFEVEPASSESDCDVLLTDEREGVTVYEAWEAEDDPSVLVVEDSVPDALRDFVAELSWDEVRWGSEAEQATVKMPVQQVREETRYYIDEPPEYAYRGIGRLEALEILERRGFDDADRLEDAWYYPRRDEAAFLFVATDAAGESYRTLQTVTGLDDVEQGLVRGQWPDEDAEDATRQSIEDLQGEIYETTTWAELEAGIIACWRRGIMDYEEIAAALDSTYATVTNSIYHMRDKLEMRAREQREVYPVVPEDMRPDDLLFEK